MNELTNLMEQEIRKQYRSVRQFSTTMGIPNSTVVSAIKNGISGTAYDTVIAMCKKLNIDLSNSDLPMLLTKEGKMLLLKYNALDEKGQHAIDTILEMEYLRCNPSEDAKPTVKMKRTNAQQYARETIRQAIEKLEKEK